MIRPSKLDYFVGAFLSVIINSAKKVPVLIDETETSKVLNFSTDNGDYNVFVKYSTAIRHSDKRVDEKVKDKMTCDILFNEKEYKILSDSFTEVDKRNFVVAVCTNGNKLNENYIVVIPYDIAMRCLAVANNSKARRITITRLGKEGTYKCYGVNGSIKNAESVFFDWQKYL